MMVFQGFAVLQNEKIVRLGQGSPGWRGVCFSEPSLSIHPLRGGPQGMVEKSPRQGGLLFGES